jgi:hypothetical protein
MTGEAIVRRDEHAPTPHRLSAIMRQIGKT